MENRKKPTKNSTKYSEKNLQILEEQRRSGQKGELQKLWQQEQDKLFK